MRITYDKAFRQAKDITIIGAAVLIVSTTTGCSDSGSSSSALTQAVDKADSGCSSSATYCECMKHDLKTAISNAVADGNMTEAEANEAYAANDAAYDDCYANNGMGPGYWHERIS